MHAGDIDLSGRELSIEELEAIAAAGWLGDAWNWVKKEVHTIITKIEHPFPNPLPWPFPFPRGPGRI